MFCACNILSSVGRDKHMLRLIQGRILQTFKQEKQYRFQWPLNWKGKMLPCHQNFFFSLAQLTLDQETRQQSTSNYCKAQYVIPDFIQCII